MKPDTIGFIGAGQMARALAQGFVRSELFTASNIWASDPVAEAQQAFEDLIPGARTSNSNRDVAAAAGTIVLAVKPQQMATVLSDLAAQIDNRTLVISIAAGVTLARLAELLPAGTRIVRVMPNTPCLVGQGASGYALGDQANDEDDQLVDRMLSTVGRAVRLEEKLLDAVTGLSGSGPAFVCLIIEALSDGGVRMGLPRNVATDLAVQTVRGTAELIQTTGDHPAIVKDRVTSPGGTTIAGLEALEAGGLRSALMAAVEAATTRSIELGTG